MKQTILLTGKTGQVGSHLYPLLESLGEVVAPDRNELDLSHADAIRRVVRNLRPSLIVNAAAYTAVDAAETDEESAHTINASAPAVLAEEAKKIRAGIVHYSTDYVFDGLKRTPYTESDATNPINAYGRTKLVGEQAVRGSGASHFIFRTSWVYSTRGRNFLLTILRLASERDELRIVRDQVGAPTCAAYIAAATTRVLTYILERNNHSSLISELSGTYHMTSAGQASWYDFARAILEEAQAVSCNPSWLVAATQGRNLMAKRVVPISKEEFRSPTARPGYSVLSNSHLAERFGVALPKWRTQLQACFNSEAIKLREH
jgi:dTDP-4-dehydrorhamnose reductase